MAGVGLLIIAQKGSGFFRGSIRLVRRTLEPNEAPRPEAEVSGRPPLGGRLREVAPVGGFGVKRTSDAPQELNIAFSTADTRDAKPMEPSIELRWGTRNPAGHTRDAKPNDFTAGRHAGSLEALRVTRPEAVSSGRSHTARGRGFRT